MQLMERMPFPDHTREMVDLLGPPEHPERLEAEVRDDEEREARRIREQWKELDVQAMKKYRSPLVKPQAGTDGWSAEASREDQEVREEPWKKSASGGTR